MCPQPVRPSLGDFSEEVREKLANDINRARWMDHRCELCGQSVSAQLMKGKWVPDAHWPSVRLERKSRFVAVGQEPPTDSGL